MDQYLYRRCTLDDHFGTILYVGEVPPTIGPWLGVDWDEKRGKHDGSHEGIKYFDCLQGHGSFVRPQKVNLGINDTDALSLRYATSVNGKEDELLFVSGSGQQKTIVETVGFEKIQAKQSQFEKLTTVGLARLNVRGSATPGSLSKLAPNIKNLDLTCNLLSSLEDVLDITQGLEKLEALRINGNRIRFTSDDCSGKRKLNSLKALYANRMLITWSEVCILKELTPNVSELYICFNRISVLSHLGNLFDQVQILNLEGNSIEDWREVQKLSSLPRLERLVLNSNKLSAIFFTDPENDGKTTQFKNLVSISLSSNVISEWDSINQLNKLRSLTEVRFKQNPLLGDMTGLDARQEIIARIRDITNVNGSPVTVKERKSAELSFLNKYSKKWAHAGGKDITSSLTEEFLQQFPRYVQLIETHGCPQVDIVKARTLKEGMLSLTFRCPDDSSKREISKKVPETMSLQQLRRLIQKLLQVDSSEQKLSYLSCKTNVEVEMDDNMRQLSYFSIASGDVVLVRW